MSNRGRRPCTAFSQHTHFRKKLIELITFSVLLIPWHYFKDRDLTFFLQAYCETSSIIPVFRVFIIIQVLNSFLFAPFDYRVRQSKVTEVLTIEAVATRCVLSRKRIVCFARTRVQSTHIVCAVGVSPSYLYFVRRKAPVFTVKAVNGCC